MTDTKRFLICLGVVLWCLCSLPFAHGQDAYELSPYAISKCGDPVEVAANTIVVKKRGGAVSAAPAGDTAYCTGCQTTADADLMCEDFEGSIECETDANPNQADTCICGNGAAVDGWVVTVNTSTTSYIDFNSALANTDMCGGTVDAKVVEVNLDGTPGTDDVTAYAYFGDGTTRFYQFYINIISEGLSDTDTQAIGGTVSAAGSLGATLNIKQAAGGALYFRINFYGGASIDSSSAINTGTWYGLRFQFANNTADTGWQWWIDYGAGWVAQTASTSGDRQMGGFKLGVSNSLESFKFQLNNLKADATGMPSDCSR